MSFYYKAYALNICSEIAIPELIPINEEAEIDVHIFFNEVNIPQKALVEGINIKANKRIIYRFWEGIGKFELRNGTQIIVDPDSDVDLNILRRFLIGTVFAVFLYQRNFFCFTCKCF